MTPNKEAVTTTRVPERGSPSSTSWEPDATTTAPPARYTDAVFKADLEMASRRLTNEINADAEEAALLRRRRKEGKAKSKPRPPRNSDAGS